jgi:hypothetical protein
MDRLEGIAYYGTGIAAGELAVLAALAVNNPSFQLLGFRLTAGLVAPVIEEAAKCGLAVTLRGDPMLAAVAFGSTEGVIYGKAEGENSFDYRRGLLHACFGALYMVGSSLGGGVAGGLGAAIAGHMLWNNYQLLAHAETPVEEVPAPEENTVPVGGDTGTVVNTRPVGTWSQVKARVLV